MKPGGSKHRVLVSWVGRADLNASINNGSGNIGPVAQALQQREFDLAVLMSNFPVEETKRYVSWLRDRASLPIQLQCEKLSSPTNLGEIYQAVHKRVRAIRKEHGDDVALTFHLSPGTPAMAAIWIILAKTRFAAELIESSVEQGVKTASVPFDLSAEFIPDLLKRGDDAISALSQGGVEDSPEFANIVHRSAAMRQVIARAQMIAPRHVPVLIEGESGTGKELLARAIHGASMRSQGPFLAVNCGAISPELFESEFFGHKKGAFSGAVADRRGYFEGATGGTLFLDEIGELPLPMQVKLLRVLQENEVTPVGGTKPAPVDARIIAATNRNLAADVGAGEFREDLFYRLAVAVLRLPPIRKRPGDLTLLIEALLERINTECATDPAWEYKKLSTNAKNILMEQPWLGNIRELSNTLTRATVWTPGPTISKQNIEDALLENKYVRRPGENILGQPLSELFDLDAILAHVEHHYLERAMRETAGNKTKAAKILGFKNYQTLSNRLKRAGLE